MSARARMGARARGGEKVRARAVSLQHVVGARGLVHALLHCCIFTALRMHMHVHNAYAYAYAHTPQVAVGILGGGRGAAAAKAGESFFSKMRRKLSGIAGGEAPS